MKLEEKKEIINYLSGIRDHREGVSLYMRFGQNLRLKRLFTVDDSHTTHQILTEELRKLAGMTEEEFRQLPRRAKTAKRAVTMVKDKTEEHAGEIEELEYEIDELNQRIDELNEELESERSRYEEAPDPVKKMIKIRDQYPFLNSQDCPDVLKIILSDMITAYYQYKEAHAKLSEMQDDEIEQAATQCERVINNYINNREIRAELDYYKEHGEILGKAERLRGVKPENDFSNLSDMELIKQLQSANSNCSKHLKAVKIANEKQVPNQKAEELLNRWTSRKEAIKTEIESRKKK